MAGNCGEGGILSFSSHLRVSTEPISLKAPLTQVDVPQFIQVSPLPLCAHL